MLRLKLYSGPVIFYPQKWCNHGTIVPKPRCHKHSTTASFLGLAMWIIDSNSLILYVTTSSCAVMDFKMKRGGCQMLDQKKNLVSRKQRIQLSCICRKLVRRRLEHARTASIRPVNDMGLLGTHLNGKFEESWHIFNTHIAAYEYNACHIHFALSTARALPCVSTVRPRPRSFRSPSSTAERKYETGFR